MNNTVQCNTEKQCLGTLESGNTFCPFNFWFVNKLVLHELLTMEDASDSQVFCPFCEQTFGSDAIKEHMGREHLNLTLETTDDGQSIWTQNKVKIEPKELKFSCPVCKVEFISQQSYKVHMKSIHT